MSEKVKLPKKVAEALDKIVRKEGADNVVKYHAKYPTGWANKYLDGQPIELISKAIYCGYEIEPTPEERVHDYYETMEKSFADAGEYDGQFYNGSADAIVQTLNILGIKIAGVNA